MGSTLYVIVNVILILKEPKRATDERPKQVVGSTSELLESDRCSSVADDNLEGEISQYLLLHHDYFAKREIKPHRKNKRRNSQLYSSSKSKDKSSTKTKFKEILPKLEKSDGQTVDPLVFGIQPEIVIDSGEESDLVYGTYDDNTNCIVIVSNDNLRLGEAVTEITTSESNVSSPSVDHLQAPASDYSRDDLSSPTPSSGYESIGSPSSEMDIWDECVSELFPSLI